MDRNGEYSDCAVPAFYGCVTGCTWYTTYELWAMVCIMVSGPGVTRYLSRMINTVVYIHDMNNGSESYGQRRGSILMGLNRCFDTTIHRSIHYGQIICY